MRLGIDASNIRGGGGLTHLIEILRAARPYEYGIANITVWGGRETLSRLPGRDWLTLSHQPMLDRSLPWRAYWQQCRLGALADSTCDLLFVPGGTYLGSFRPFVTMSQNLLPFAPIERRRFGLSANRLRFSVLEKTQAFTFQRAQGVIFLTESAREIVLERTGALSAETTIIPHGINDSFRHRPRAQFPLTNFSTERPFHWLYVSIVNFYKHQWNVVRAAAQLHAKGFPIALTLVGPANDACLPLLQKATQEVDPRGAFIHYAGALPYSKLPRTYKEADAFVFASSCETFGQILVEAMASGLPIACSNRSVMHELLGAEGVYFDPEDPKSIAQAMCRMMVDTTLRENAAEQAYEKARAYSWEDCAAHTLAFLSTFAQGNP